MTGKPRENSPFRDDLPEGCPPGEAREIISKITCYRLVHNDPPTYDDFRSQRTLEPNRNFGVSECRTRGLSIFIQAEDAVRVTQHSRNLRGAKLAQLNLSQGAGYIEQTGSRSHHTWWPFKEFDILANCEVTK